MADKDCLIIPTVQGLLDCFNIRANTYKNESTCHLISPEPINSPMVLLLFSFIFHKCNMESSLYEVKYSDLKAYRGHSNSKKGFNLKLELMNLENIICFWDDKQIGKLADITMDGRNVIINSEYFYMLFKAIDSTTKLNHRPAFTNIIHKSILLQRNHSAIEITVEICKLVERRGQLNQGESAHISITTLIDRCPTLRLKIEKASRISRKNQIINTDLEKTQQLLLEHTKIYQVFNEFEIILPEKISISRQQKIEFKNTGRTYK